MYNTMNNPSAHPSYSHYYLLSPSTLFFSFLYILLFFCTSCCFLHILLFFAHLIVFCTSYCFALLFHCTFYSYFSFSYHMYALVLCYLYNLYSYYFALSTERTWFDYISLLIIPCITYVTNKETLTLTLAGLLWGSGSAAILWQVSEVPMGGWFSSSATPRVKVEPLSFKARSLYSSSVQVVSCSGMIELSGSDKPPRKISSGIFHELSQVCQFQKVCNIFLNGPCTLAE